MKRAMCSVLIVAVATIIVFSSQPVAAYTVEFWDSYSRGDGAPPEDSLGTTESGVILDYRELSAGGGSPSVGDVALIESGKLVVQGQPSSTAPAYVELDNAGTDFDLEVQAEFLVTNLDATSVANDITVFMRNNGVGADGTVFTPGLVIFAIHVDGFYEVRTTASGMGGLFTLEQGSVNSIFFDTADLDGDGRLEEGEPFTLRLDLVDNIFSFRFNGFRQMSDVVLSALPSASASADRLLLGRNRYGGGSGVVVRFDNLRSYGEPALTVTPTESPTKTPTPTATSAPPQTGIQGWVYLDMDSDQQYEPWDGETPIMSPVVTINLYKGSALVRTTNTSGGFYGFMNLSSGEYAVEQVQPPGYTSTTPNTLTVTVTQGTVVQNQNFGEIVSTPTPTATLTATQTHTPTSTPTLPVFEETETPTPTDLPTATSTATSTETPSSLKRYLPLTLYTWGTPAPTKTLTPTITPTGTPTLPVFEETATPTLTSTPTWTPIPTFTPTSVPSSTPTNTARPTATFTPTPTPTVALPSGDNVRCNQIGVAQICAWVSNGSPSQYSKVWVYGRLLFNGVGQGGQTMNTDWYYTSTTSHCSGVTNSQGRASCSRGISRATKGYRVNVDVMIGGYYVTTWFTPR